MLSLSGGAMLKLHPLSPAIGWKLSKAGAFLSSSIVNTELPWKYVSEREDFSSLANQLGCTVQPVVQMCARVVSNLVRTSVLSVYHV